MRGSLVHQGVRFYISVDAPGRIDIHSNGVGIPLPGHPGRRFSVSGSLEYGPNGWQAGLHYHRCTGPTGDLQEVEELLRPIVEHAGYTWARQKGALVAVGREYLARYESNRDRYVEDLARIVEPPVEQVQQALTRIEQIDARKTELHEQIRALQSQITELTRESYQVKRVLQPQENKERITQVVADLNSRIALIRQGLDVDLPDPNRPAAPTPATEALSGLAGVGLPDL